MSRVLSLPLAGVVLVLLSSTSLYAQQAITTASITGRISDPSGAAIPGATVTILNLERNQRQETSTSTNGVYRFLSLSVGPYELSILATGFAPKTVPLVLSVGEARDVSISLSVAGVAAEVDVSSSPTVLELRRTQLADLVSPREIDELPLNGRNYLDLALLTPGVSRTIQRNTERFAETSAVPGTGISIAGQRNLNNTFLVDGVSANDDAAGLAGTYFAEDVIREFQVVTSGGIAEFGRASAGIINVVTRSGRTRCMDGPMVSFVTMPSMHGIHWRHARTR